MRGRVALPHFRLTLDTIRAAYCSRSGSMRPIKRGLEMSAASHGFKALRPQHRRFHRGISSPQQPMVAVGCDRLDTVGAFPLHDLMDCHASIVA